MVGFAGFLLRVPRDLFCEDLADIGEGFEFEGVTGGDVEGGQGSLRSPGDNHYNGPGDHVGRAN